MLSVLIKNIKNGSNSKQFFKTTALKMIETLFVRERSLDLQLLSYGDFR